MMGPDPLRSARDVGSAEDTSLAMPSDKSLCSGQQRVLNQVHSIKRGKSKYIKDGTTSPRSPPPQTFKTYTEFGTSKLRGASTYNPSNSTMSAGNKARSRSLTTKITRGRHVSTNMEPQVSPSAWPKSPNGLKASRSDPALVPVSPLAPAPSMKAKGQTISRQNTRYTQGGRQSRSMINGMAFTESQPAIVRSPSGHSQTDGKIGTFRASKIEQTSMVNSAASMSEMTLEKAVELLSDSIENSQQYGASYIQHVSYNDKSAKTEVLRLEGIPYLVNMLQSSSPEVAQAASGALRNLVFQDLDNKKMVQKCGGIAKVLNLLKNTESTETKKQLTGLLWNLSSADELKPELMKTALPCLTTNVLVPYTSWSESDDNTHVDPSVFHCATGCLRNLSFGRDKDRQTMRDCDNLIDSLMKYVVSCVAEDKPDDTSVENCVCTLQNLTFQMWQECPEISNKYSSLRPAQSESKKSPTVGCFSPRSSTAQNEIFSNTPKEMNDSKPLGVKWLCDQKAMDAYLSLLSSSKNNTTLEACCGALQNLTGSKEIGSTVVSEDLFQKMKSQLVLPSLMKSPNHAIQKAALSLLDNMSRKPSLYSKMAKQTLPELLNMFSSDTWNQEAPAENIATLTTTINRLLLVDSDSSKKVITKELVLKLIDMSEKGPKNEATTAASKLLYNLWSDKFLQSITKKLKIDKRHFVNTKTIAASMLSSSDE